MANLEFSHLGYLSEQQHADMRAEMSTQHAFARNSAADHRQTPGNAGAARYAAEADRMVAHMRKARGI